MRVEDDTTVWWGTWTECAVAISRLKREGRWGEVSEERTRAALDALATNRLEVEPVDDLRMLAMFISKGHPLKTADTLQLAAALRWREGATADASFVCLDDRLRRAATEEGFHVLPEPPDEEET
ncbi:MAG TPA: type II toxin-antitoxin system VapC family toxin [Rubrobacteraceae bacterium]|nr:type II toxin-antitoxin system VapC family toxin [Rubrobacteraceae bacterium]